jgi:FkbM family methyltransferase
VERQIQSLLQRLLGFDRYLRWFSRFKIRVLRWDRNERDVLHFIEQMPVDGVVLDIGANVGIMTVPIARRVREGHVHAFEPIPDNFAALSANVAHFHLDNVSLHQMALGEDQGELEMVMPEEQSVRMQGLSHAVDVGPDGAVAGVRYTVPKERLDDFAGLQGVPVAGIKIDVENFEQFVFRGARRLIEENQPLVYTELGHSENRTACFGFFEDLGYTVGVLESGQVVPFDPRRHDKHNFFMCPPRS